jgi:membrane-associated phospholipid phosphatase
VARRTWAVWSAACLLLAVTGAGLLVAAAPLAVDVAVRDLVVEAVPAGALSVAEVLSQLGSGAVLYPALLALLAWRRSVAAAVAVGLLAAGQVLETVLLSVLPRDVDAWLPWAEPSSGRTATAVLGTGLALLVLRARPPVALLAGVAAGLAVGTSRVLLDRHALSDVVVALGFGTGLLGLAVATWPLVPDRPLPLARLSAWTRGSRWAWALPALAALVAVVPAVLESPRMIDLAVYVGSAGVVGEGDDLYRFRTEQGLPFTYPPFAALVAEPLARVPLPLVQLLWTCATLAAAVAVAAVAMRPVVTRLGLPVTSALLLLSTPVRSHVRFGQVGLFLVLLVSLDLLRRGRSSGWGVGLATAVKLTPGVYLLWLAACGSWSRLRSAAAWCAGASVAGLVLLWPSSPTWLSSALWDSSRFGRNDIPGNQSVRGMLLRALDDDHLAERVWLPVAVALLAVGVLGARRLERSGERLAAVGVLAATSVAVSPISWQHHLVWLVLPIAALVAADRCRLAAGWAVVSIVPTTTMALAVDVPVLGALLVDTCGLTAVAAVLLLPRLVLRGSPDSLAGSGRARLVVDGGGLENR